MLELRSLENGDTVVGREDKKTKLLVLPEDVRDDWNQVVAGIVRHRIAALPRMTRIEIYACLEGRKQTDEYLTSIIMTEAARALDELLADPVSYTNINITCVSNFTAVLFAECRL